MPELKWNEYDFVECLGVLPEIDEYETGHHFKVEKDGLILNLSIWQYDNLFEISLYQSESENPFMRFHLSVRGKVVFINDKRGSYLSFQDCAVISSKLPLTESGRFCDGKSSGFLIMELEVEPQIKIQFIN